MKQMTLARGGFERFGKTTKRAAFLADMDQVIPWGELCALIEPHYPKTGGPGRPPVGLERMLRIHFLQHWFNLSDPAVEEALYESMSMREFVGIDFGHEPVPDETTICKSVTCWSAKNWAAKSSSALAPTCRPKAFA
jgi:IS5 family transposase